MTVPLWLVYLVASGMVALIFSLLFTRKAEVEAKHYAAFLQDIVKASLIQYKKEEVFIPRCYFDRTDSFHVSFDFVKDGLDIFCKENIPK